MSDRAELLRLIADEIDKREVEIVALWGAHQILSGSDSPPAAELLLPSPMVEPTPAVDVEPALEVQADPAPKATGSNRGGVRRNGRAPSPGTARIGQTAELARGLAKKNGGLVNVDDLSGMIHGVADMNPDRASVAEISKVLISRLTATADFTREATGIYRWEKYAAPTEPVSTPEAQPAPRCPRCQGTLASRPWSTSVGETGVALECRQCGHEVKQSEELEVAARVVDGMQEAF